MAINENQEKLLEELVDYIENWRTKSNIELTGILEGDNLVKFVKDIQSEIKNRVSMAGKNGKTLLLYTGSSADSGKWIWEEMEGFCEKNSDFYYISSTEGGSILWQEPFQNAIRKVIKNDAIATRILSGKSWNYETNKEGARINQYAIEGEDLLSLDDFVSKTLTEQAVNNGNKVIYVAGQGWMSESVGMQTEIPTYISEAWIGKDIDEAMNNRLTIVNDMSEITDANSPDISDVSLYKTEFYLDADGKITGVKLVSELDEINVGTISPDGTKVTYGAKLGIMTDAELEAKYSFLNDGDNTLDMFRLYEYQKSKSSINLDDTKVYFDANGKAIGLSYYDDLSGKAALELKLSDTESYLSDADMSNKYVDYDNYSNLDKLKARQYEYERNQISEMVDNNVLSQNDIELKTFDELKQKYTFIDKNTDAEVIKELQIAEYRDAKYGTNTSESIEVHYDENGKMSCTSNQGYETTKNVEIKNNSKYTTIPSEFSKYQSAEYMSSICPEYELLSDLQKLQLQQIELDARNHNFTKLQQTISSDATGSVGNVKIVYDVEGNVTGIDMSGIGQGSAISTEGSSAVFDISSDGSTKVCLDSQAGTRTWWRNETKRNIRVKLKKMNYNISLAA